MIPRPSNPRNLQLTRPLTYHQIKDVSCWAYADSLRAQAPSVPGTTPPPPSVLCSPTMSPPPLTTTTTTPPTKHRGGQVCQEGASQIPFKGAEQAGQLIGRFEGQFLWVSARMRAANCGVCCRVPSFTATYGSTHRPLSFLPGDGGGGTMPTYRSHAVGMSLSRPPASSARLPSSRGLRSGSSSGA